MSAFVDPAAQELVDRTWSAITEGLDGGRTAHVALYSKGHLEDVIPGLSDVDFRIVVDSIEPSVWRKVDDAFYRAYSSFAAGFPGSWRLVEHTPGSGYATREVDMPKPAAERNEWIVLRETAPDVVHFEPIDQYDLATAARRRLEGYASPYDPRRDPPINVAREHVQRHLLFSICWHYYAPALRCAAFALGRRDVRSKWDAVRWREADGVSLATEVLSHAASAFHDVPGDLADRCSEDVAALVQQVDASLGAADGPTCATASSAPLSVATRAATCLSTMRMFTGRWRYYAGVPDGFDLPAVLRIDRGHLGNFMFKSLWEDAAAEEAFYDAADDSDDMRARMDYFRQQYRATDSPEPRAQFMTMHDHLTAVRDAMEPWYAQLVCMQHDR